MSTDDDLPKLPNLEEILEKARRQNLPEKAQARLPLPELLRQLSKYVSEEDIRKLTERPEPITELIETNCPILEQRRGNGKITLIKNKYGTSVICEQYNCTGLCSFFFYKSCGFARA